MNVIRGKGTKAKTHRKMRNAERRKVRNKLTRKKMRMANFDMQRH